MTQSANPSRRRCRGARTIQIALLAGAAFPVLPAQAQEAADASPAAVSAPRQQDAASGDVVVTALRQSSRVQDAPIAITALTGESLANAGVAQVTDYAKLVPGLRIQDNGPGQRRISLRGILASGEPTVGTYYDEVPIAGSVGVSSDAGGRTPDFALFDIDRVEVLRGPQGTLYGASAMTGAIRVIYSRPEDRYAGSFQGDIHGTKGGGLGYSVSGMVNVPLVEGLLAVRGVIYRSHSDGYIDNSYLGRSKINDSETTGGRILARLTPAPNFTLDGSVFLSSANASSFSWNPQIGKLKTAAQAILPYEDRSQIYNLTARWDIGPAELTAVSSWQHRRSVYASDDSYYIDSYLSPSKCASYVNAGASTPCTSTQLQNYYDYVNGLSPAVIYYPGKTKDWTNELRLSSTSGGPLHWTVGAFTESRKNITAGEDARVDAQSGEIIKPLQLFYRRNIEDEFKQVAGFGEASFKATEKLTLTAGLRYFHYEKTVTGGTDMPWELIGATYRPTASVKSKENGWLTKFNVDYAFTRDIMIYAQASQGFRPGGANQVIGLAETLTPYTADKLWNYEFGAKTAFFNRRLYVNGALYQIDWSNMQVSGRTLNNAYSFISNAGAARIRGAEMEVSTRPAPGLEIGANASYIDAKLTEDQISSVVSAPGRAGDRLPYIPHFTGSVSIEYKRPVSGDLSAVARADVNYVGASYSEFRANNPLRIRMDDYSLANLRVGIEGEAGKWGAYLYVSNLFDATAINRASQSSTPNSYSVTSALPRTFGLSVNTSF